MRVLGLDLETTGLDTANDRITELGAVLWETDTRTPLVLYNILLHDDTYPELSERINKLTGITDGILKEFGVLPKRALMVLESMSKTHPFKYVVAHNGHNFDRPMLMAEWQRQGLVGGTNFPGIPWLDTKFDIPWGPETTSRRLRHLALDQGFINPFEHRAVTDVLTMLKVMSAYDINQIIEYSKIPWMTVRAVVDYNDRQLAKDQRYSWEKIGSDIYYPKCWIKRIKQTHFELEKETCSFPVVILDGGNNDGQKAGPKGQRS